MKTMKAFLAAMSVVTGVSCTTMKSKQDVVAQGIVSKELRHLYTTDIYSVYFDTRIKKCVLHARDTFVSGYGGGVGIGLSLFDCDPQHVLESPNTDGQTKQQPPTP